MALSTANRWRQEKEVVLIISSAGTIYFASADKEFKLGRVIELSSLKAVSLIAGEKQQGRSSLILHHATSWDSALSCATAERREAVCRVVKYLYWKSCRTNLPVYLVPEALKHKVLVRKDKAGRRRARYQLPGKLRAVEHDIYPEEASAKAEQEMQVQKKVPQLLKDEGQEESQEAARVKEVMEQLEEETSEAIEQKEEDVNPHALILNGLAQGVDIPMDLPAEEQVSLMKANAELQKETQAPSTRKKQKEAGGADASATPSKEPQGAPQVRLADFKIMKVLGHGAFGKVFLVRHRTTQKVYAMKRLRKDNLLKTDKVKATLLEKHILQEIDHPFTVGMEYCFHTEFKIYFVLPFVRGGELF